MVRDAVERVVLNVALEAHNVIAIGDDVIVWIGAAPMRCVFVEQARFDIRIPAVVQPAVDIERLARHAISVGIIKLLLDRQYRLLQFLGQAFVTIKADNPVVGRFFNSQVFLLDMAEEFLLEYIIGIFPAISRVLSLLDESTSTISSATGNRL